jgi:hypothetical protein
MSKPFSLHGGPLPGPVNPPIDVSHRFSRRAFLQRSLAVAGTAALTPSPALLRAADARQKLGVAVIGAGGMGGYSMDEGLRENLVAIVDVDDNIIAQVMKDKVKDQAKPQIFHDYRKMLEQCHKDIDVVLIGTPDHHPPGQTRLRPKTAGA